MKKFLALKFILMMLVSCKTIPATLTSTPISEAAKLNEKYQLVARVGTVPVTLDTRERIIRYSLKPKNKRSIFLIIVSPISAKGEIKLDIDKENKNKNSANMKGLESGESAVEYNQYIDLILRAQRDLLRGDIDKSEKTLDVIHDKYDESYAGFVLRGAIALVRGDSLGAAKMFQVADRLFPKKEAEEFRGEQ